MVLEAKRQSKIEHHTRRILFIPIFVFYLFHGIHSLIQSPANSHRVWAACGYEG